MRRKNKYEDIQIIELEDKADDIVDIYINCLYNTDKTVGVIVNKELAEYIMDELLDLDETSVKEIDLIDYMNVNEYLVSVDNDGYVTVIPIEDFVVLDKTDIFYIDMDGDIEQEIIDYCVNEDKEVILFGQDNECDGNCENCGADKANTYSPAFTSSEKYSINGKDVSKEEYEDKLAEVDKRVQKHMEVVLNDYADFIDEMNHWKGLLGW